MVTKSEQFSQTSSAFNRAGGARSARRQQFDQVVGHSPAPAGSTTLPVELISQNPDNPRDHMRDLDDLTQTVREVGVVNAITVASLDAYLRERPDQADRLDPDTTYIVIDGHRRLEASRRVGIDTIKVTVDDALVSTDEALLEAAFISNYHRDGMTELEEANALEKLVKFYGGQSKASKRLGMAQSTISTKLSYLKLSPELQADLAEGRRPAEQVRNLGKLSPEDQRARADERAEEARLRAEATAKVKPVEPAPTYTAVYTPPAATQAEEYHGVIIAEPKAAQPTQTPPDESELRRTQPQDTAKARSGQSNDVHESALPEPRHEHGAVDDAEAAERRTEGFAVRLPSEDPEMLSGLIIAQLDVPTRRRLTELLVDYKIEETKRMRAAEAAASGQN
ncbi:ParB/RepB/Spo0J family partition protein [Streptomyces sp. NBC_01238]|uniref:ParB/RepB/Spo0J family partition protein n=1 Tax=Streptomyces sp. NBC_01238 TaxID=2903791 RepID=UPI002F9194B1